MPPSLMPDFFAFLSGLMTQHADLFEAMGYRMFRSFAIILIVWFGVKSALAAASRRRCRAISFRPLGRAPASPSRLVSA